eukprot:scaffold425_cov175-Amphora_coffeaeformis.AAC.43
MKNLKLLLLDAKLCDEGLSQAKYNAEKPPRPGPPGSIGCLHFASVGFSSFQKANKRYVALNDDVTSLLPMNVVSIGIKIKNCFASKT